MVNRNENAAPLLEPAAMTLSFWYCRLSKVLPGL